MPFAQGYPGVFWRRVGTGHDSVLGHVLGSRWNVNQHHMAKEGFFRDQAIRPIGASPAFGFRSACRVRSSAICSGIPTRTEPTGILEAIKKVPCIGAESSISAVVPTGVRNGQTIPSLFSSV